MTIEIVLSAGFAALALVGSAVLRELRALREAGYEQALADRRDRAFALGRLESALEALGEALLDARGRRAERATVPMSARAAIPRVSPSPEPEAGEDPEEATKVAPRPAGSGLRLRAQPPPPEPPEPPAFDLGLVERHTVLPPPSAKAR